MEITGNLYAIFETQELGSNGFRKREAVIQTEEQYPQMLLVEFIQDKVDILDRLIEGQKVKVSINLKGREWINPQGDAKYFNTIQGWKIEVLGNPNTKKQKSNTPPPPPVQNDIDFEQDEDEDDLPF